MHVSIAAHEFAMSLATFFRKSRRLRPQDPAIWVWAAVALIALVPLQHAVASRLEHVLPLVAHPQSSGDAAEPGAAAPATTAQPVSAARPVPATQAGSGAGSATP